MKKILLIIIIVLAAVSAYAQKTAEELAKAMANPLASLISVPAQFNFQFNLNGKDGGQNGYKSVLNVQPVIPITLSKNWNLIGRVIIPVLNQRDVTGYNQEQTGLGDISATCFLSPSKGSFVWGIGPVVSVPSGTNELLRSNKWEVGPSLVALVQPGKWTIGGLFSQLWSVAGDEARPDVNSFYAQPFISYGFKGGTTLGLTSENSYNWETKQLGYGLIGLTMTQILKIAGEQMGQVQLAPLLYYANQNVIKPQWGVRAQIALIFPK